MARQNLLDECRPRPWQADDEDRSLRLNSKTADAIKKRRRECRNQLINEQAMTLGVINQSALAEIGKLKSIGLDGQFRGPVEFTAGVECVSQSEPQLNAGLERKGRIGQQAFNRGLVGVGKLTAKSPGQPG